MRLIAIIQNNLKQPDKPEKAVFEHKIASSQEII